MVLPAPVARFTAVTTARATDSAGAMTAEGAASDSSSSAVPARCADGAEDQHGGADSARR
jgi:hypothetical protein